MKHVCSCECVLKYRVLPAAATDPNVGRDANAIVGVLVGGLVLVLIVTGIIIVVIVVRR